MTKYTMAPWMGPYKRKGHVKKVEILVSNDVSVTIYHSTEKGIAGDGVHGKNSVRSLKIFFKYETTKK